MMGKGLLDNEGARTFDESDASSIDPLIGRKRYLSYGAIFREVRLKPVDGDN